jgi:hypothetical protein
MICPRWQAAVVAVIPALSAMTTAHPVRRVAPEGSAPPPLATMTNTVDIIAVECIALLHDSEALTANEVIRFLEPTDAATNQQRT